MTRPNAARSRSLHAVTSAPAAPYARAAHVVTALLFVGWAVHLAFAGSLVPFIMYGWAPWLLLVAALVLWRLVEPAAVWSAPLLSVGRPRDWFLVFTLAGAAVTAVAGARTYGFIPHVVDEVCYVLQARIFAGGRLHAGPLPSYEHFNYLLMLNDGERYAALFQPVWPALTAAAVRIGHEALAPVVTAGLTAGLAYLTGRRLVGEAAARIGAALWIVSPVHLALAPTFLAHGAAAMFTLGALWFALRAPDSRRPALNLAAAGLAWGLLFGTRSLNGAAVGLVLLVIVTAARLREAVPIRAAGAFVIACAVGAAPQFAYNAAITGRAGVFVQDDYFNLTEPRPYCHRPGFGTDVGCPGIHPYDLFPHGYNFGDAVSVASQRMAAAVKTTFGWDPFYIVPLAALVPFAGGRGRFVAAAIFFTQVICYFTFYFHGIWGRYFYEVSPLLFSLFGASVVGLRAFGRSLGTRTGAWVVRALGPAIVIAFVVFNLGFFVPFIAHFLSDRWMGVSAQLRDAVARENLRSAIVFIEPRAYANGLWMMDFTRLDDNPVIYAQRLGLPDRVLAARFPERSTWVWHQRPNRLEPYTPPGDDAVSALVTASRPQGVLEEGGMHAIVQSPYTDVPLPPERGPQVMRLAAERCPGARFEFRHTLHAAGRYALDGFFVPRPGGGRWRLLAAGEPVADIDASAPVPTGRVLDGGERLLPAGEIPVVFECVSPEPGSQLAVLDTVDVRFRRVADGVPESGAAAPPLRPTARAIIEQQNARWHEAHAYSAWAQSSPTAAEFVDLARTYGSGALYGFGLMLVLGLPVLGALPAGLRPAALPWLSFAFAVGVWGWAWAAGLFGFAAAYAYGLPAAAARGGGRAVTAGAVGAVALYALLTAGETARLAGWPLPLLHIAGAAYMVPKLVEYAVRVRAGQAAPGPAFAWLTFAPSLRMGPIGRYEPFTTDWTGSAGQPRSTDDIAAGLHRIGLGIAKITAFHYLLEGYYKTYWADPAALSPGAVWVGAVLGTFAVYVEFGGYSDAAIGVARLAGITLPENFVMPFAAASLGELWRRWHMSLSFWLRDFVFTPLGGSRNHAVRNITITFLLCGLWHHFGLSFAVWGLLQAFGLIVQRLFAAFCAQVDRRADHPAAPLFAAVRAVPALPVVLSWALTQSWFAWTALFFGLDAPRAAYCCLKGIGLGDFAAPLLAFVR